MIPPGYTLIATAYSKLASGSSPNEASGILKFLLVSGELSASSFGTDGRQYPVGPDLWTQLSAAGWYEVCTDGSYDLATDYLGWVAFTDEYQRRAAISEPTMLVVPCRELQAALGRYEAAANVTGEEAHPTKDKGGRPPKYADFAATVLRLLLAQAAEDSKDFAEFLEETMEAYSEVRHGGIESNIARSVAAPMYNEWINSK